MREKDFTCALERRVENTIREYGLFSGDDRILVAYSGGKDSTAALYMLKKLGYEVEALTIDLLIGEWSKRNLSNIKNFCHDNDIRLHEVNIRDVFGYSICYIRSAIQAKRALNNCTICGVIKRWILNRKAREIGATKLVTGHNLDDEAQTLFMNLMKGNPALSSGLGPKSGVMSDERFVARVKPLYFCLNEEIKRYSLAMGFPVLYEPCPCSSAAFRRDILNALDELEADFPRVKQNIVENYLKVKADIVAHSRSKEKLNKLNHCSMCNEPTRNSVCKACELMNLIKVEA